jgi:hypothetical protein
MPMKPDALLVRAVLLGGEMIVDDFERWYESHHLPLAVEVFAARSATRWWSFDEGPDPVHYVMYHFDSPDALDEAMSSEGIANLIEDFSAAWGDEVERVRSRALVVQRAARSE